MRKREALLLGAIAVLSLPSCGKKEEAPKPINMDKIAFTSSDIVQTSFGGLGVEWGAYEDTDKIVDGGWELILQHMDRLAPSRVRLMVSYDWFCQDFNDHGNNDKSDDTWTYNFANKYMRNTIQILEYCETHHIDVAFGAWNVVADSLSPLLDTWKMMDEVTSDPRWATITGDVLDYLVNRKGFDCIKWFVNSNEPNWVGSRGNSKNWNNTYAKWEQGVKNVRAKLDSLGMSKIKIIGGDTTGIEGTREYFTGIAKGITDKVGDYGCHLYVNNIMIDRGDLLTQIQNISQEVKDIDPGFGITRPVNVWEAGLLDGKTALDCQTMINTGAYGVRMVDFTLQCLAGGINGIAYWDFDDAMHFMYSSVATTPKEWGMFSSLADASGNKQELRPWFHSSCLMTHLFQKGNRIYCPPQTDSAKDNLFRSIGTRSPDGKTGGFLAVNKGARPVTKTFYFDEGIEGETLYLYRFADKTYRLGEDGYIIPNEILENTSLGKKLTLEIPTNSAYVVANRRL